MSDYGDTCPVYRCFAIVPVNVKGRNTEVVYDQFQA